MFLFEALFKLFNDMYLNMLGFPDSSAGKESSVQCRIQQFDSGVMKFPWRQDRLPTPVFLGFPGGSAGKQPAYNVGHLCSWFGKIMATHSSILAWRIPMDRGAWQATCSPWGRKESDTAEGLRTAQGLICHH